MILRLYGDARTVLQSLLDASVHSIVTDLNRVRDRAAWTPEFWSAALRVLRPGGHLLAFADTRTGHRLVAAVEDAGFEIRDQVGWLSGLVADDQPGLRPALELICMARRPFPGAVAANVLAHGTGALNIGACRIETTDNLNGGAYSTGGERRQRPEYSSTDTAPGAVPLSRLDRGIGAFQQPIGRWPANVVCDDSDEVAAAFAVFGERKSCMSPSARRCGGRILGGSRIQGNLPMDSGTAARFFFRAPADVGEPVGARPPLSLLRYLCRLVTPAGGVVLDPFAGSGCIEQAALDEGFSPVVINSLTKSSDVDTIAR